MIALLFDIGGGYLIAKNIEKMWLSVLAAFGVGVVSPIVSNTIIYFVASDVFSPSEIAVRMVTGMFIHPIIVIISLLIFRRRIASKKARETPA